MNKQMKTALAALVELAQGYHLRPGQIAQVAEQYEVEAWQLEGFFFEAAEVAQES